MSNIFSTCKKTLVILLSLAKNVKDEAIEDLKIKEFTLVNDCFQIKHNEVFSVFLQRLFTLFFLSILAVSGFSETNNSAEEITITGRVIEKTSREPLIGASITLHNASDSTLVKGTIADSLGNFRLNVKQNEKDKIEFENNGLVK